MIGRSSFAEGVRQPRCFPASEGHQEASTRAGPGRGGCVLGEIKEEARGATGHGLIGQCRCQTAAGRGRAGFRPGAPSSLVETPAWQRGALGIAAGLTRDARTIFLANAQRSHRRVADRSRTGPTCSSSQRYTTRVAPSALDPGFTRCPGLLEWSRCLPRPRMWWHRWEIRSCITRLQCRMVHLCAPSARQSVVLRGLEKAAIAALLGKR